MSGRNMDVKLTEDFLQETLPSFFEVDEPDRFDPAYEFYMEQVACLAGDRGENESLFAWGYINHIARDLAPRGKNKMDFTRREFIANEAGNLILGIGCDLESNRVSQETFSPEDRTVTTTGKGTLLLLDGNGIVQFGRTEHNDEVDSSYGDPTPYVLEKLGWAKYIELTQHQGADWGQGYEALTEYLRKIGRIGKTALPHVGMATAHEIPYSSETKGQDRNVLAYASGSNYTLTANSVGQLLSDPRFFEQYRKDLNNGQFTNIADWLAGRLDSLVARRAYEMYLDRPLSTEFPYLDDPDYTNVNNN